MSYRQSLYPGASTNSLNTSTSPSPSAINSLLDKQRQVEHFHQILKHSENLLELYKGYSDKYHVLVGGSEAVGDVVEHWQNVFRSTSLALGSIHSQKQQVIAEQGLEQQDIENVELGKNARPDQLVRLPVDQTN
ncbi:hypothetical protein JCM3765_002809 [Sporobolomyces pararoseus]